MVNKKTRLEEMQRQQLTAYLIDREAKMCNCAGCYQELLSQDSHEACRKSGVPRGIKLPHPLFGRVNERPYCQRCFSVAFVKENGSEAEIASVADAKRRAPGL